MQKIEIKYITKELPLIVDKKRISKIALPVEKAESFWALRGISLAINPGEAIGLIGINGSGKQVLAEIIAGRLKQTTGFRTIQGRTTYASSRGGLEEGSTGFENLQAEIDKIELDEIKASHLINGIVDFCELGEWLYRPVREYSVGMYARLSLAIALFTEPQLVVLNNVLNLIDIPFSKRVNQKITELKDSGVSFVIADNNLVNVERFCERTLWLQFGMNQSLAKTSDVMLQFEYFQDWFRRLSLPEKNSYLIDRQSERINFDIKKVYENFKIEQFKNGFTRKDEPKMRRAFFKERGSDPLTQPKKNQGKSTFAPQKAKNRFGKAVFGLVCLCLLILGSYLAVTQGGLSNVVTVFKAKTQQTQTRTPAKKSTGTVLASKSSTAKNSAAKSKSATAKSNSQKSSLKSSSSLSSSSSSVSSSSSSVQTQTINVGSGDTLEGLAQKYATDVNTIMKLNNFSSVNDLKAGSIIKVPK